jgi:Fe2+ transport system protein FeoA
LFDASYPCILILEKNNSDLRINPMLSKVQLSLSEVSAGNKFMILKINLPPETNQRLRELGFSEDTVIRTVVIGSSKLICEVNNTRFGINHDIAKDIIVEPLN